MHLLHKEALSSAEAVLSTASAAKKLLELALQTFGMAYIVIDGLDEYVRDDRKEISMWFQNFVSSIPKFQLGTTRCLFVSQEDGAARKDFSTLSQIKITHHDTENDIRSFCGFWHQKIDEKFGSIVGEEYHVQNVVSERSRGQ